MKSLVYIDAEATSHPLDKRIYGQFIEHLGRCIYGGIWVGESSRPDVEQIALELARMASGGLSYGFIFIPSANTLSIGVVAFAPSAEALSQSIARAVEQGLKPETVGLRVVPISTQVVETAVATRTAETVVKSVSTIYTGTSETIGFRENAVHGVVGVPHVVTRTAEAVFTRTAVAPTAVVETVPLVEKPVRRTDTVPTVITQINTFVVATTATVVATVSETGTVSVVTVPMVITYTITVPITVAAAAPAPAPPTPTGATGTATGTLPVAKPPLPRLPGLEGARLAPAPVKPEKKPEVEKEILVI